MIFTPLTSPGMIPQVAAPSCRAVTWIQGPPTTPKPFVVVSQQHHLRLRHLWRRKGRWVVPLKAAVVMVV